MNAGIPASSERLRSQSPLRPHSTTELRAQIIGAEPSSGAAGTADGRTTAEPASIPIAISRLITLSSSAYFTV